MCKNVQHLQMKMLWNVLKHAKQLQRSQKIIEANKMYDA